ncbi:MAG TPA: YdcF family protein [Vitreimonas sp.]|nr:YdcF family protein [Vitreimonas sp.]
MRVLLKWLVWWLLLLAVILFLVTLPQLVLILSSHPQIFDDINSLPSARHGVVFGAKVSDDKQLSDVSRERAEAAVMLFKNHKVEQLFVSGDNRHNTEAEVIAKYIMDRGVPEKAVTIDTNDTCRHLHDAALDDVILITQKFHLPRALKMCQNQISAVTGLNINNLDLLAVRGDSQWQILKVRTSRFFRESILTWAYITGFYDWYSDEAEEIEKAL